MPIIITVIILLTRFIPEGFQVKRASFTESFSESPPTSVEGWMRTTVFPNIESNFTIFLQQLGSLVFLSTMFGNKLTQLSFGQAVNYPSLKREACEEQVWLTSPSEVNNWTTLVGNV